MPNASSLGDFVDSDIFNGDFKISSANVSKLYVSIHI
jgi:hypothetical protein